MKHLFSILLLLSILLSGCITINGDDDKVEPALVNNYTPVNLTTAELDSSIQLLPAQEMLNSGKIYVIGDILFINEKRKGFHVFDNSDKTNPIKVKFIQTLGATDLAVKNNVLYVNQATDLIALQYNFGQDNLKLMKRIKNTFPKLRSPQGRVATSTQDSVTIDWIKIN